MKESYPDYRRVIIEVPTEKLADLVQVLAGFALKNNITIDVGQSNSNTKETSINLEEPRYNPDFTSQIFDEDSQKDITIITNENLADYAQEAGRAKLLATRAFNALSREYDESGCDNKYFYKHYGIKADTYDSMLAWAAKKQIYAPGFGKKSLDLLLEFKNSLYY